MNTQARTAQLARRHRGFSLLEVLIAVVILSLGLLGIAGLQMNSLRNNQSAMERSMAVVESYSIIDAMRVDRVTALNGGFNIALNATPVGSTFAINQINAWRARLTTLFGPGATGSIACNGTDCTITVQWNDQRGTEGSNVHQAITQVQL